ncbi:winged helix-turn-helix transcriptional regulator [Paenibacillus kribbensis]|uniref:winged helix-turn-helix transcriptional regulator n=1 Tax=Paenibacillus kribbensis TaxID=172713 RepID=UPI00083933EC|nr:helix-turn-helix domain-containing protein [Paenibacillus kribbensis]
MEKEQSINNPCSMNTLQKIIGGKWKIIILWLLSSGTRRFGELNREIDDITQAMLTKQLRELEADGLVERHVYPEVPPKVEYSLTKLGEKFIPILSGLYNWSEENLELRN